MYNILKEKIREKKLSYKKLSEKMRISESGFNKKINGNRQEFKGYCRPFPPLSETGERLFAQYPGCLSA